MPENVGAIRSADSAEKSGDYGDTGESANAPENAAESEACSSVARGPAPAEVLAGIEAAVEALDSGQVGAARARLRALATAVRADVPSGTKMAFERDEG